MTYAFGRFYKVFKMVQQHSEKLFVQSSHMGRFNRLVRAASSLGRSDRPGQYEQRFLFVMHSQVVFLHALVHGECALAEGRVCICAGGALV
jgi:hypothetical protein